jgi:hypothetical protein
MRSDREREGGWEHYGAIYPCVMFDQETVSKMNWEAVYGF